MRKFRQRHTFSPSKPELHQGSRRDCHFARRHVALHARPGRRFQFAQNRLIQIIVVALDDVAGLQVRAVAVVSGAGLGVGKIGLARQNRRSRR